MGIGARFQTSTIRQDVLGGVTTAIVSLPLALAFGSASGAGLQAGLYGAILVGLCAALFGGTRSLISEPTGPMTLLMTAIVMRTLAANPDHGLAMAFTVVIIAGVVQIAFGVLKLGRYVTYMPYSVISGFMSGIGVLLVLSQLPRFLGASADGTSAIDLITSLPGMIATMNGVEFTVAAVALVTLVAYPRKWRRFVPPQLVVLILGILATALFLRSRVEVLGAIPIGLPRVIVPRLAPGMALELVIDGVVLGLLGCIDSLLTAMIADSLTRDHHDSNRELIGQGIGNIVSGLFGGLPGAGATMGTVVNIQTGARSPWSAIIRSVLLFAVAVGIAPLLRNVPYAILAAITVKVGIDIFDWSFLGRAHRISRSATIIMWSVLILTVLVDLIVAVGVGVFVANILTIERLTNLPSTRVRAIDPSGESVVMSEEERQLLESASGKVLLFYLSGPMIFGVGQAIYRESAAISERTAALVVDLSDVSLLSTTVNLALENVIRDACKNDTIVYVSGATPRVLASLTRLDLPEEEVRFTTDRPTALRDAVTRVNADR